MANVTRFVGSLPAQLDTADVAAAGARCAHAAPIATASASASTSRARGAHSEVRIVHDRRGSERRAGGRGERHIGAGQLDRHDAFRKGRAPALHETAHTFTAPMMRRMQG